jgi:ATP-dependent helicase HrpA
LAEQHQRLGIDDPELDNLRWMIEEFRVSKFAQNLGTSVTVSEKRLDKQVQNVRESLPVF